MRILTVPNWSFGRDRDLLHKFALALDEFHVRMHYLESDVDHNRTVSAFQGEATAVFQAVMALCDLAFERIDLNRHVGVHPRIGALDVCPFVVLPDWNAPLAEVKEQVEAFAEEIALEYKLPVYLYEKSEKGRHEADLPSLRKGGFGALAGKELQPDYGPTHAHPRLGVTVMGVRDFLIAMNVNLATEEVLVAKELAKRIRTMRMEGDERFLGVRALGFPLATRGLTQVSLNLTLPDLTAPDPIIEWITAEASKADVKVAETELIGVIREQDLSGSTRLPVKAAQIVDKVEA